MTLHAVPRLSECMADLANVAAVQAASPNTRNTVVRALEDVSRSERATPRAFSERYRVGPLLSRGSITSIHRGVLLGAEGFQAPIAIKRFTVPHLDAMLAREARILAPVLHPNVIAAQDFVRDADDRAALVLELVDGVSLARLIGTGALWPSLAVYIAGRVLDALACVHSTSTVTPGDQIVHRQVIAEHVLLSWSGAVKLTGFGRATCRSEDDVPAAPTGNGANAQLPAAFSLPVGHRTDLHAVGVLLWAMLTGRPRPGSEPPPVWSDWLRAHAERSVGEPLPSDDLGGVVLRLLDPDPAASYTTAWEAGTALAHCPEFPPVGSEAIARTLRDRFATEAPARRRSTLPPLSVPRFRTRTAPVALGQAMLIGRARSSALRLIGLTLIAMALGAVLGWLSRTCTPLKACAWDFRPRDEVRTSPCPAHPIAATVLAMVEGEGRRAQGDRDSSKAGHPAVAAGASGHSGAVGKQTLAGQLRPDAGDHEPTTRANETPPTNDRNVVGSLNPPIERQAAGASAPRPDVRDAAASPGQWFSPARSQPDARAEAPSQAASPALSVEGDGGPRPPRAAPPMAPNPREAAGTSMAAPVSGARASARPVTPEPNAATAPLPKAGSDSQLYCRAQSSSITQCRVGG